PIAGTDHRERSDCANEAGPVGHDLFHDRPILSLDHPQLLPCGHLVIDVHAGKEQAAAPRPDPRALAVPYPRLAISVEPAPRLVVDHTKVGQRADRRRRVLLDMVLLAPALAPHLSLYRRNSMSGSL